MANPNSNAFSFNGDVNFSDCVLIIEIETNCKLGHFPSVASHGDGLSSMEECPRIEKLHVNSAVLVEKSPFFHDLLKNATTESGHRCVALTIHASEETAVTELLNYMHGGALTSTSEPALLDVLKVADRFQVASCMKLCASLLLQMPMTAKAALVCLSLLMADDVRDLVDAAKQFMKTQPIHADEIYWSEMKKLTLDGIEAVLSSDTLEFFTEDMLFGDALSWTRAHYPDLEDQRRVFSTRLARYLRFPYMSPEMLKDQVLSCNALDSDFAYKAVVDALYFKITTPFHHHHNAKNAVEESTPTSHRPYVRRPYYDQFVKVVEFEFPCPEAAVYFDLCMPVSYIRTEEFMWAGHWFRLSGGPEEDRGRFVVHLESDDDDLSLNGPLALEYELAARSERTKRFVSKSSGSIEFRYDAVVYETPLLDFKAGRSLESIDGVVYLELKLRRNMQ